MSDDLDLDSLPLAGWQRDFLRNMLAQDYYAWAGIRLHEVTPGHSRLSFRPRKEMLTPWGTLNGGVINGLVEVPSFVALLTQLEEEEFAVTNDIFLQHVRPLPGDAEFVLEGQLLRRGKRLAWTEVTVLVEERPHSYARITKTLLEQKPPARP